MKQLSKKLTSLFLIALLVIGTASFAFADTNAKIYISGDDAYVLYVDGNEVGRDWQTGTSDEQNWSDIEMYDVTLTDDFVLAIEAADLFGTIAGVSAKVVLNNGTPDLASDDITFDILNGVWKVSNSVNSNWKTEKLYAAGDNWTNVTQVTPHASWPSAGNWGWSQNAVGESLNKNAFFKYYIPKPVGTVNVYHYIVNTTTFVDGVTKAVSHTGTSGTNYSTTPLTVNNYTASTPQNANGTFTAGSINVIYYYTPVQGNTEQETTQPATQPEPTQPQGPTGTVQIVYVDELGNTISPSFQFSGEIGTNYSSSSKSIDGYTLVETPANASGSFIEGTTVVSYVYSSGTVVVEEEEIALGESTNFNFDEILPLETPSEDPVAPVVPVVPEESEIMLDEATPLADALPQTGQLPVELFYGIGGLISAAGVFLRRK